MVEPAAAGAGAGAALRKEAEAAVMLARDGLHEDALARADELAAAHTGSPLVLFTAGFLHHDHAGRAKEAAGMEVAAHHLNKAEVYLTEAKRLVPNCIDISSLLARVLFEASKRDESMAEVYRGIGIPSPVDPAENNVTIDDDACANTTEDQRVENSREMARKAFLAMLTSPVELAAMRRNAKAALMLDRDGHHDEALARVDKLADGHAGSSVVLYAAALVHRDNGKRAIEAGHPKVAAHHLKRARTHLTEAKRLVPNCIEISALLARVLFEASKHDEADAEIRRAVEIPSPIDPAENNVMIDDDACANTTKDQRVENSREMARKTFGAMRQWMSNLHVPLVISKVLEVELDADDRKGAAKALQTANDLAKRCPYSARAQLFGAYMKLNFARGLDATMDRRPFLDRIRRNVDEAAGLFDGSLVLAMFHAKLCFVLGFYDDAYLECGRAFTIEQPVDPKLEDVPPGSVIGQERADRLTSVKQEFGNLVRRLWWVAKVCWDSMTSEEQNGLLSVTLAELQKYCDDVSEDSDWAARTISDALSFVKKTRSWRFWICPYCVGKKLPDAGSLLRHLCSKHPAEKDLLMLQTLLDPNLNHDTSVDDNSCDDITVRQDSEDNYFFCFKKTDQIFERLFIPPSTVTQAVPFAEVQEKKCKEGTEILQKMKQNLKNLPTDELSAEFDKARREIQDLWRDFLSTSVLDYRVVILPLAESFIWTKLIKSTSEDKASSKSIDNSDIDTVFPDVVHAPGSEMMLEYLCKYMERNKNHECGDDHEDIKPSGLDKTLVDAEINEQRHGSSATWVYKRVSKLVAKITNVEQDKEDAYHHGDLEAEGNALKKLFSSQWALQETVPKAPCLLCIAENRCGSGTSKFFCFGGMKAHYESRHDRFLKNHEGTISTCPSCANRFANSAEYKVHKNLLGAH